jgi:uncharacterized lipoprotein YmbA
MRRRAVGGVTLAVLLAGAACTAPPARYYLLNPVGANPDAPIHATAKPRTVTILPVAIPDYLDRPEIVARTADNGLAISNGERWGERLPAGLGRVLAVNLGTLLAKDNFIVITGERQPVVDYELFLVIDSFERDPQGQAVLTARWTIRDARRDTAATRSQAIYREPVAAAGNQNTDAAAEVAALNRNLDRLTADLATSLQQLPRTAEIGRRGPLASARLLRWIDTG